MGKISDALKKFQNESNNPVSRRKSPNIVVDSQSDRQEDLLVGVERLNRYNRFDKNLITYHQPQSFGSEQFRMLKSKLLFPISGSPPRSVMVTSAMPGEGKSFISTNLAISIAQNINEYVILIDCDIRNPTIHKNFGFEERQGLTDYLSSSDLPLAPLLLKTGLDKLTILPGGRGTKNPAELLSSNRMSQLLDELKSRYSDRYVVIDSPPPQLTAETKVIARQVDGILIVVRHRHTPRELVLDLKDELGKEKILGIVFNMCDFKYISYGFNKYKLESYRKYYESNQIL